MLDGINILSRDLNLASGRLRADPMDARTDIGAWDGDMRSLEPLADRQVRLGPDGRIHTLHASVPDVPAVLVVGECSTTMELAAGLAGLGALPEWGAVIAVRQSAGRGQMRRAWASPPGNLHASFLLPAMEADDPYNRLLPLLLGHLLCQGLTRLGAPVRLKWPNDLVQGRGSGLRKTCGLLIEDRGGRAVAGFGVNLAAAPEPEQMRAEAAFPAAPLCFENGALSPLALWVELVKWMKNEYAFIKDSASPADFVRRLEGRLLWMGEEIRLIEHTGERSARIIGLDIDGGLRVCQGGRERTIYSGSIFHEETGMHVARPCEDAGL